MKRQLFKLNSKFELGKDMYCVTYRVSGEQVFVDASGGMDMSGARVFLLVVKSCGGTLPIGE